MAREYKTLAQIHASAMQSESYRNAWDEEIERERLHKTLANDEKATFYPQTVKRGEEY